MDILYSKIVAPNPAAHYMRKSSIMKKLKKSKIFTLTLLHSGPGYGKSSSLAQYFADENILFSWYQVTENDDSILPFLKYLYESIKTVYTDFELLDPSWDQVTTFLKVEHLNKLFTLFCNAFAQMKQEIFIVIDDFHMVQHVFQINYVLDQMMKFAPPNVHFVIATRTYPTWDCLHHLKNKRLLTVISEEDFVFTTDEISLLFEDYYETILTENEVNKIYEITEGWVMAVILLAMQVENERYPFDFSKITLQDFDEYLSYELFQHLDWDYQQSLFKFSLFDTFSADIIQDIFGEEEVERLDYILNHYAFIQKLSNDKEYRFHSLIKQFLVQQYEKLNQQDVANMHKKIAIYFINSNNIVQAFYHITQTNDEPFICEMFIHYADYFMQRGNYKWLLERIKKCSFEMREQFYPLYYIEGECLRIGAFYKKASMAFDTCIEKATHHQDLLSIVRSKVGLAKIYVDTLQPSIAKGYLHEALALSAKCQMPKQEYIQLNLQYVENLVNIGQAYQGIHYWQQLNLDNDLLHLGNIDIRMYLRQGALHEAKLLAESRLFEQQGGTVAHRETDALLSLIYAMMGNRARAKESAYRGLQNSTATHEAFNIAVAHIRNGHAELLLNPYDPSEAITHYETAVQQMEQIRIKRIKAECYVGLAIAYGRTGNVIEAKRYAFLGLTVTEKVEDRWVTGLLKLALLILYVENDLMDEARQMAKETRIAFEEVKDSYCLMVTYFWSMYVAMKTNDVHEYNEYKRMFELLINQHAYHFFLSKVTLFGARDLVETQRVLHFNRGDHKPAIYIKLFGPTLFVRNWQAEHKVWHREKAKELFIYLYLNRNRYCSKEEMTAKLFPNSIEEVAVRDFKVAYNALLKVLEPNRSAREEPFYIERKQSMYRMCQRPYIMSDIEYFEQLISLADRQDDQSLQKQWLLKAVQQYTGDLYEDSAQVEWIQQERERYKTLYVKTLQQLAHIYFEEQQFEKCLQECEKIIVKDPTWEEAYRLMMWCHFYLENKVQVQKTYERCERVLLEEYEMEPMSSTTEIFEKLIKI
ncbi:BTAD domain-containing putative transcriptional regulator [Lysinibacillus sp. KU-BSD001]|uniref:BTAD domain-containing putative transcriptional regulator n=1 Tax=Lysinibacillus sp. KU-BSD001 TaxID=3141328 RepID=UPI0036E7701E